MQSTCSCSVSRNSWCSRCSFSHISQMLPCMMISNGASPRCDEGIRKATASGCPSRSISVSRPSSSCTEVTEEARWPSAGEPEGPAVGTNSRGQHMVSYLQQACHENGTSTLRPPASRPGPRVAPHVKVGKPVLTALRCEVQGHPSARTYRPSRAANVWRQQAARAGAASVSPVSSDSDVATLSASTAEVDGISWRGRISAPVGDVASADAAAWDRATDTATSR